VTYAEGGSQNGATGNRTANRGDGGNGTQSGNGSSNRGGTGVVIIRYAGADLASIGVGLTYSKTTASGDTVYTFTAGTGTVSW
jgi:hypothetical protein